MELIKTKSHENRISIEKNKAFGYSGAVWIFVETIEDQRSQYKEL
ncbi:hypothetical protein [Geotalea uraniireducens]|nr:hypothetical protein [Geotalea uraniireducens]